MTGTMPAIAECFVCQASGRPPSGCPEDGGEATPGFDDLVLRQASSGTEPALPGIPASPACTIVGLALQAAPSGETAAGGVPEAEEATPVRADGFSLAAAEAGSIEDQPGSRTAAPHAARDLARALARLGGGEFSADGHDGDREPRADGAGPASGEGGATPVPAAPTLAGVQQREPTALSAPSADDTAESPPQHRGSQAPLEAAAQQPLRSMPLAAIATPVPDPAPATVAARGATATLFGGEAGGATATVVSAEAGGAVATVFSGEAAGAEAKETAAGAREAEDRAARVEVTADRKVNASEVGPFETADDQAGEQAPFSRVAKPAGSEPAAVPAPPPRLRAERPGAPLASPGPSAVSLRFSEALGGLERQAPASPAHEQPATPGSTTSQIVRAMSLAWRNGVGEATVRLQPESLGTVTVALRVERGVVTATLASELPAVRESMQAHEGELRASLAHRGLQLDRLVVSDDTGRGSGDREGADGYVPRRKRDPASGRHFQLDA